MAAKKPAAKTPAKSAKSAAVALRNEPENLPAITTGPVALPANIRVKRMVTVPSLVLKNSGDKRVLLICDAMRISKVVDKKDTAREPATVCTVGDIETGEQFIFLVPSVVKSNLERDYPNDEYVGKTFYIECLGKRNESQRYKDFRIMEVEAE